MRLLVSASLGSTFAIPALAEDERFSRLSLEGPFVVLDATGLDQAGALDQIKIMDEALSLKIADADSVADTNAYGSLKAQVLAFTTDVCREFMLRNVPEAAAEVPAPAVEEATVVETGSQPTPTEDTSTSNVSQQSDATEENEEHVEAEEQGRRRRVR